MTRLIRQIAVAAAVFAIFAGPVYAQDKESMDRTITVSASGSVTAEPDEATISSGVSSEAKTARDALSKNTEAMKKVIGEMKAQGIEAKDIRTTQFNVQPVYSRPEEGQQPVVTGYRVVNSVSVQVRNLDKLGSVLDQLVTAGANQMGGISFEVSKAETLKDDARKDAMANALRRAKLLAAAGGADVGEVVQILEDVSYSGPQPVVMARRMSVSSEAVPVERGSQELEARVTVTWKLK